MHRDQALTFVIGELAKVEFQKDPRLRWGVGQYSRANITSVLWCLVYEAHNQVLSTKSAQGGAPAGGSPWWSM